MEVDKLLADEAEAMFQEEETMKKRLEEMRKARRNVSKATWQENLGLISLSAEERRKWALQIENDVQDQKKMRRQPPTIIYVNGPKRPPSVALARLIAKAATEAKVTLTKPMFADLEKSGLPAKYAELCEASLGQQQ